MDEPELIFHDSVPLPEEQLGEARETARKQNGIVLAFFKRHDDRNFTPVEVYDLLYNYGEHDNIMLNSIRRSITNLTKAGKLIKCQWSESRQGQYGKMNRVWKYNPEYVKPITPPKKLRFNEGQVGVWIPVKKNQGQFSRKMERLDEDKYDKPIFTGGD